MRLFSKNATAAGAACIALLGAAATSHAAFSIQLNYLTPPTPGEQAAFDQAKATWESVITDYKPLVTLTGITINASFPYIDGTGMTLGQAGPTALTLQRGSIYATAGKMEFDSADAESLVAAGKFSQVVLHEMGHVLGIGTLWKSNHLYVADSGEYTGVAGLQAYNTEFDQSAAFVPVELGGSSGTANGHWDEVDGGGANTGIVSNITHRDMRYELMTGWLNSPTFMSTLTRASMIDLGYQAVLPEPATLTALVVCVPVVRRRRRI